MIRFAAQLRRLPIAQVVKNRGLEKEGPVQRYIDHQVPALCAPYVPLDKGALAGSAQQSSFIGSGRVCYSAPHARRCYYHPAKFRGAPMRGNFWFQRMKAEGGRERILRGAAALAGGRGSA